MPDEPLIDVASNEPYEAFLIEVRSIGGLSGSPVFLVYRPRIVERDKSGNVLLRREPPLLGSPRYHLLGLIRSHWDLERGPLRSPFANEASLVNMGIAVVTPATEIHALMVSERVREDQKNREQIYAAENAPTPD